MIIDIERLPMVALRGLVVFPYTVVNFEVAREISIEALTRAMNGDQRLFLVTQKDMRVEMPTEDDVYQVGVIGKVRHVIKLQGDAVRVLLEGVCRAKIRSCELEECFMANVEVCESDVESSPETEAYMRSLLEVYEEYAAASGKVSQESILALTEVSSPAKLVDTMAVNLLKKVPEKQDLLETFDVYERYEKMIEYVKREIEIANIEQEISNRTRTQIEKQQREMYLREQMRSIQTSLGMDADLEEEVMEIAQKVKDLPVSEETREKLNTEVSRLARMNNQSAEYNVSRTYLETVISLPFGKYTEEEIDLDHVEKVLDEDHYGMKQVKERVIEYLAVRKLKNDMKGPILCLAGPPGVGKTSIASSIAKAIGRKFVRMSLGGVKDEAEIRGHRRTYIGAIPGRIVTSIKQAGTMNPLFLLDEIDKLSNDMRGDPASAMLEVLDPEINNAFQDHYLDIDFDLSSVMFVTTANDVSMIPRPLYDRMEVINLSSYTTYEKEQIAMRHLIPKQLEKNGLTPSILKIEPSAVQEMITGYTSESGVRSLERMIGAVCRKAARKYLGGKKSMIVRASNLHNYLGVPKYSETHMSHEDKVGVVTGLAWTAAGGTTLPVEVCVMQGKGNVELTGQLGDVMKESARTDISLVRSIAPKLGIDEKFYTNKDVHIHVPEGAIPKDGPSAGITMALAVTSALSGRKIRGDFAMTGEVTLTGRVLPIGGLKEKTLAALREGITNVIIPEENLKDKEDFPKEILRKVKFYPVKSFIEVVELCLLPKEEEQQTVQSIPAMTAEETGRTAAGTAAS